MSKLLIDDRPLMVLPQLAVAIGLNEAVVLQQIHYWLKTYAEAKDANHYHDGRWWVYNTAEQWQENFPFWSESTVRRALTSLREPYEATEDDPRQSRGPLLLTGNYNEKGYDRTLWYTIDYDHLLKMTMPSAQNEQMDVVILSTPIPETTTETTPETTEEEEAGEDAGADPPVPASFEDWLDVIRETPARQRYAPLLWMHRILFPKHTQPSYSKMGGMARKVGGASRMAELLWKAATRPPTGDVLAYCYRVSRGQDAEHSDQARLEERRRKLERSEYAGLVER